MTDEDKIDKPEPSREKGSLATWIAKAGMSGYIHNMGGDMRAMAKDISLLNRNISSMSVNMANMNHSMGVMNDSMLRMSADINKFTRPAGIMSPFH